MGSFIDLTGKRFGRLLVEKRIGNKGKTVMYECKCSCGNTFITSGALLRAGKSKSCGCKREDYLRKERFVNLKDKRFGRLLVIEYYSSNPSSTWLCKCDCGNLFVASANALLKGRTQSCGCLRKETTGKLNRKPLGESSFNKLFNKYKDSATRRGLSFSLSEDQFKTLINSECAYCGSKPGQYITNNCASNGGLVYNGVDRVDNSKGYTLDNVVPCCKHCNFSKGRWPLDEFIGYLQRVAKKYKDIPYEDSQTDFSI